tara:strand:- start:251 stop:853 length:603 start_codon:yes stop_codon:yes gene_type:complete
MSTKKYIMKSFLILLASAIFIILISVFIGNNDFVTSLYFLWFICAVVWVIFFPIEIYVAIKEKDLNYIIERGNKSTFSLYSVFCSEKTRQKRFVDLLASNNIYAFLNKEIFSEIINNRITEENKKLDKDKELLNNEMNDKDINMKELNRLMEDVRKKNKTLINKKNEELEILKKEIVKEKEIYRNLQGRHKYLDLWVKNR